ncbi:zinc finger protein 397-like [Hemicordylus capensis]|uniref:zinc finger protein 397-like n=1 Tax=Hemicordylus capensis TaxID=884348 RepID=UPI0023037D11|nr:zinc finger protein 397-like [Hemicordylus capensis]XP_053146194.1 zinc finger protein 397-like [Hemicordylus capensis]XP_053146196.1 zinc finger protein 397-like [Hemicordylus capensis]
MATEPGEAPALGLHFQAVLEQNPCMKTKVKKVAVPKSETRSTGTGKTPCAVIWRRTVRQCLRRRVPQRIKEEPDDGLSLPRWEARCQEFLGGVEFPRSGQGDAAQWLETPLPSPFGETVAQSSQPREEAWRQFLPCWSGSRQPGDSGGPDTREGEESREVKEEMEKEEAINMEMNRHRFRGFLYQEAEGPQGACRLLWELGRQWLQPERHTKEQMLDLLILEQFLAILPPEMQSWVKEGGAETCAQAVALAEDFLQRQQEGERQQEQVPGLFHVVTVNFSDAEQVSLGNTLRHPGREVKEEDERSDHFVGTDGLESKNVGKPYHVSPERANYQALEENVRDQGEPERQEGTRMEKWRGKSSASQVSSYHEIAVQQRIHKGKRRSRCSVCGKSFRDESNLIKHWRTHPGEKPYKCADCGKIFCWISQLDRHRRTHTGERPYKCSECGKTFSWSSHLKSHKRIHTGERPYKCAICSKSFLNSSGVIRHQRTHTGEKPFECSDCSKSFGAKSSLISHQTIHTGEKSYQCVECGKSFSRSHTLVRHQRIHATEKPYKCSECAKSFHLIQHLIRHQRNHTGEKPHQCLDCSKSFLDKSSLVKHRKIHTGEKPYTCSDCGKCFSQSQHLLRHQIVHTGEGL